jgi:stage III sporulation protein AE
MFKRGLLVFLCFFLFPLSAHANDNNDYLENQKEMAINYEEIQTSIDSLDIELVDNQNLNFKQMIDGIIAGTYNLSLLNLFKLGMETLLQEVYANMDLMVQVIVITIIIAIFTNFTSAFSSKYIGEVGFFVTYLILSAILIRTFQLVSQISEQTINQALVFMQALVPSYFATVSLTGNFSSTLMFHQTTLMIIGLINWFILRFILPLINLIVVLEIANNITEEHLLTKLTELFKTGVSWALKTIVVLFFGLNVFQSLTMPMLDTVANKSIKNAMQIVPVIGSSLDGVADTVLGSTVLIKNAVGLGGVMVLLFICILPIIKIFSFVLIYKGVAAIIQPISNNRVVNCLSGIGDSAKLLLGTVFTVALLFIISMAIVTISTNYVYMAR